METEPERIYLEIDQFRIRLEEAEETLRAIRRGEVDALVVGERRGEAVYTLKSPDRSFRLMIEAMGQGAVTLTPAGVVLYCNRCFARMLKMPAEAVIGAFLADLLAPGSRELFQALLRKEDGAQGEVELQATDGMKVPAYLALSSLWLDEERVLCLVVTDLTEQKRSERIAATSDAKDRFLAALSHELRTPLTPVLAVISNLEASGRLPAELRGEIAMVRRNVELEARLIDDLLDVTRITRGKLELQYQEVDLRQVLEHAIRTSCGEEIAAGRLRVITEIADGHPMWADAPRLTQVFWNLLSNAVKFTPEDGTIGVRSWIDEPGWLAVEISDTGIGIDPELLPRIFDAFEQGEARAATRFGAGLGLGLAISRAIVEYHGGTLEAHSGGPGCGATFRVRLPLLSVPAGAADVTRQPSRAATPAERALRILLVEDHADTAEAIAELLRLLGHEVTVALTLAAGLAAAEEIQSIDLVVSDLGLPDGNGLDLMRELAGRYGLKGIALSGYGMEEDLRRSREAGFERHLTKPIDFQSLQAVLREVVG
ncbi:MAG TPA: ATP-binding protein [Thermoanaerobaculia bacterium]|jgi:PAS domain S-box-containing protein